MFDCHYDLLTYIYINRYNLDKVKKYLNKIFKNNITGGIFNLFYMSPKEMKEELNIEYKDINIIKNLETVNNLINKENLIPKNIYYIYGIEGLDYLEKINDIEKLYKLGVRSVNIVWNNDNKFGGGAKGNENRGLTTPGKLLVQKLVDTGIAIDLSHSNKKTFFDITKLCKELKKQGKNPKVFASHSNVKRVCNHVRNLSDEQLLEIKNLDGIVGIVAAKPFCIKEKEFNNKNKKYATAYLEHIKYLKKLFNNTNNIAVSSDDMTYYNTKYYEHFNCFKQYKMQRIIKKILLKNNFTNDEIKKILYTNAYNFLK